MSTEMTPAQRLAATVARADRLHRRCRAQGAASVVDVGELAADVRMLAAEVTRLAAENDDLTVGCAVPDGEPVIA